MGFDKNFDQLKADFKKKEEKEEKMLKKHGLEISKLKEDYKECLKYLQKETFERNKAETTAKVLKETLEAQIAMNNVPDTANEEEQMEIVDKEEEESLKESKTKSKHFMRKCVICDETFEDSNKLQEHRRRHEQRKTHVCDKCETAFVNEVGLKEHVATSHNTAFTCQECSETSNSEKELMEHMGEHSNGNLNECQHCRSSFGSVEALMQHQKLHGDKGSQNCDQCEKSFGTEKCMNEHKRMVHELQFNCQKCDKVYSSMKKLRRHDWRNHREVPCNICKEIIESRQEITNHRKNKHNLFKKVLCKFFPACLDENECLFSHEESETEQIKYDQPNLFCPKGDSCLDQSCSFSESNHRKTNDISCRFQANCNRKECRFVHSVQRRAFLDADSQIRKVT